jgi:hypothetical protein
MYVLRLPYRQRGVANWVHQTVTSLHSGIYVTALLEKVRDVHRLVTRNCSAKLACSLAARSALRASRVAFVAGSRHERASNFTRQLAELAHLQQSYLRRTPQLHHLTHQSAQNPHHPLDLILHAGTRL